MWGEGVRDNPRVRGSREVPDVDDHATVYRERSSWPGWAALVYWGAFGAVASLLLVGYDTDLTLPARIPLVMLMLAVAVGLERVVGGLTVLVQERRLFLHLGSVPVIRRSVPYQEILELESVEYQPFVEFGGWGVRGMGKKKAWTARGNRAVRLRLTGERELYVGSDHPRRLEERIRTTAGDRLGPRALPPSPE
jgi:hypothetical protein